MEGANVQTLNFIKVINITIVWKITYTINSVYILQVSEIYVGKK